jgi:hypothetical protein
MSNEVPKLLRPLIANGSTRAFRELLIWTFRIAVIAAIFWLKSAFVSIEKYDKDRGEGFQSLKEISEQLIRVNGKLEGLPKILEDYEKRLRVLEHGNEKK